MKHGVTLSCNILLHKVSVAASSSQSAQSRVSGKYQSHEQRNAILEAAEKLFLEVGIENTHMIDIAERTGITRVTLYRYFANRDEVALAVHRRLMEKTGELLFFDPQDHSLVAHKRRVHAMISNFNALHDMYRFVGMFDRVYLDHASDFPLTRWTLSQLVKADGDRRIRQDETREDPPHSEEVTVILNTVIWFLEKLALRGELTWSNKEVPLEEHLRIFEEMVMGYFDRLIETS
jgi:AcrR family transcriptional regulator